MKELINRISIIVFIVNIAIILLIVLSGISNIILYKSNISIADFFSLIYYYLSKIFYITIIIGFMISILNIIGKNIIITKLYFLLIPQIIISIFFIFIYILFIISFTSIDYFKAGYPILIISICIPVNQINMDKYIKK